MATRSALWLSNLGMNLNSRVNRNWISLKKTAISTCLPLEFTKLMRIWDIICRFKLFFSYAALHVASILLRGLLNIYAHSNCILLLFGAQICRYFSPPWNSKLLPPQTAYMFKGHMLPILYLPLLPCSSECWLFIIYTNNITLQILEATS